jgi:hypothetical protein
MYIPLDNLYHWIYSLTDRPMIIYYFYPHGSKKLSDCTPYPLLVGGQERKQFIDRFSVICHDQEPLNFDFYQNYHFDEYITQCGFDHGIKELVSVDWTTKNLNIVPAFNHITLYDNTILIHSEQNSQDVIDYQAHGYETAHYWCHGVLARDWYRFAQYDHRLDYQGMPVKDFLIYARDWSGTREYRLKFLELLKINQLQLYTKCYFSETTDNGQHYTHHDFTNPKLQTSAVDLGHDILPAKVSSNASADYDTDDFCQTKISVILETVFDNTKIHLTEKICRALACGHPFLLAAGPGSLQYLKNYGFKTFEPWLDESYNRELDSVRRLEKIVWSMKQFASQSAEHKHQVYTKLREIADYNQQRFFSTDFAQQLATELQNNLNLAIDRASYTRGQKFLAQRKTTRRLYSNIQSSNLYLRYHQLADHLKLLRRLRQRKKFF